VEAQAQVRRAEELYRGLVEQLPAAVYLSEVAGPCQYVSPQIEQLYGITQAEFIAGGWRSVIHPADLTSVADMVRNAHAAGHGAVVEYRITHPRTGEVRWMHEQTALVAVPGQPVAVVQGLITDTTDRTRAVEALRASEAERRDAVASLLRAAETERARVAAELHDDTVQTLTGAVLTADRLRRDIAELAMPAVLAQADRLRDLLGNAIERTRRLMFELSPQLLQAGGIAAAVRELAESNGAEAGFAVRLHGDMPRYPPEIEALVYRTLREAILNARKHARCTELGITLAGTSHELRCEVTDNGVGFVPAETATRWDAHLHLGLRSAMERITLAGGTLTVDSAPGLGTTIALVLPLAA
jgi:PAS domain S-box-containing protein